MSNDQLLNQLRAEIDDNLQNEQFGVEQLAQNVGMSRSSLHRKLHRTTGQSASQFIREHRLARALEILISEDLNVSEVAFRVGFSSSSYFSKSFTQYFGYPPVEAKNRNQESADQKPIGGTNKDQIKSLILIGSLIIVFISGLIYLQVISREESTTRNHVQEIPIAVIPFKNLGSNDSNQYFADGVMNAILNKLSNIKQLRVTSRTSVEQFRQTERSIPDIGKALDVSYILEGSAQKDGNDIKIIVQLVDVESDASIWSQDYIEDFKNTLILQNEIAERVTHELSLALSIEEKAQLNAIPTQNAEAYNKYLMGLFQHFRYTSISLQEAVILFQEVIDMDPNFVDAYQNLAEIWIVNGSSWGIVDQETAWSKGKELLLHVLELDPRNPEAYDVLATGTFWYDWDFKLAGNYFDRSAQLRGFDGDWSTGYFLKIGKPRKALEIVNYYISKNPLDSWNYYYKAEALNFLGRKEEAIKLTDRSFRRFDDFLLKRECVKLYCLLREHEKFISSYEELIREFSDRPPLLLWMGAIHAQLTNQDLNPFIGQLEEMYQSKTSGSPAWFLALTHAARQDEASLFTWLKRSYDRGEVEMTWLKMEPALDSFKADRRYLALLKEMNFPD